jgi:hypothetical protein
MLTLDEQKEHHRWRPLRHQGETAGNPPQRRPLRPDCRSSAFDLEGINGWGEMRQLNRPRFEWRTVGVPLRQEQSLGTLVLTKHQWSATR